MTPYPERSAGGILVWEGLNNREIRKIVGPTEQVIKNHLRSTFDKLGVWSRLELAMYVASHGERTGPLRLVPAKSTAMFSEPTKRLGFEIAGCRGAAPAT